MRTLYPPIEPYHQATLPVSKLHTLYFEQVGHPQAGRVSKTSFLFCPPNRWIIAGSGVQRYAFAYPTKTSDLWGKLKDILPTLSGYHLQTVVVDFFDEVRNN